MMDSLAMFFGAKKRRSRSPTRKVSRSSGGEIMVGGKLRKLHRGKTGSLYYKTKTGRRYVDAKFIRAHSPRKMKRSSSPKRRRASPKRRRASPKRRRASPKRRRASPKRKVVRRVRYGYGLGQPSLIDMMGPAGLVAMPSAM